MQSEVETISIVKANKEKIEKDNSFPDAFAIYIELDKIPCSIWIRAFENEWKNGFYSMKRKMDIQSSNIRVVVGGDNEIKGAVDFARRLVDRTNTITDMINNKIRIQNQQEEKQQRKSEENKNRILNKLKDL